MRISVVTVCLNARDGVQATMRSVLDQTYQDLEYIVVDGKSTDDTLQKIREMVERYPHRNVRVISERDKGIYDAMNKGIELATGAYINFMNVGDRFHDNEVVADMERCLMEHPDVLYGDTLLDLEGKQMQSKGHDNDGEFPKLCHQSVFAKTTWMKQHPFDLRYKIAADYNFLYGLFKKSCLFVHVDRVIAVYKIDEGQSTNNRYELRREHCMIEGRRMTLLQTFSLKMADLITATRWGRKLRRYQK